MCYLLIKPLDPVMSRPCAEYSSKPTIKKCRNESKFTLGGVIQHQDLEEMKGYDQGKCLVILSKLLVVIVS